MALAQDTSSSTLAKVVATAIVAGLAGYYIGQASSIGLFGGLVSSRRSSTGSHESCDWDRKGDPAVQLKDANSSEECKMVLVVRSDLGMTKGKIGAQCGHATLACYKEISKRPSQSSILQRWEQWGQTKVALQVKGEAELDMLQQKALMLGLCAEVVHDAGRTQIASGSATVLGIGPGPKLLVDQVTGDLRLL